jgi:diguanylate cyclase (GGDEF)-like protein
VLERQLVWWVAGAATGVLAVAGAGLWLALVIARRVTGAVQGLNTAARALVDGKPFTLPALQLRETEAVGRALLQASATLQRARHAAQHDPLTGLSNRALFEELLQHQLAGATRRRTGFALLLLDLDDFKRINDERGHAAGDRALRATARRIHHCLRSADAAARLGGDEFAVVLDGADPAQAQAAGLRLLDALGEPDGDYPDAIGVSIGVALWPDAGRDATALMNAADAALYAAKRGGKGRMVFAPVEPT